MAGYNMRFNIWRMTEMDDDYVGGASISGSIAHWNVMARFQGSPPHQAFLQQGLETVRTYRATVIPGTLDIRERDEAQVVAPFDHQYYGDRFRIVGVRYADFNPRDPRNYMILELTRSVRAHDQQ